MDDQGIGNRVKGSRRAMRRLFALAVGLLAAAPPLGAIAQESSRPSRLPPVSASSPTIESEFGSAVRLGGLPSEMERDRFYGVERLPQPRTLSQADRISSFATQDDGKIIQLTSLQESSAGDSDASKKDQDSKDSKDASAEPKKDGQEPMTFGRRPESNALQFLRAQDVLLAPGAWQADTGLVYALFDNDFPLPIFDQVTGDLIDVVEGQVRRRLLYSPLAVRYGLTKDVQLFGILPVGYSNTQISTFGASDSTNAFGIGDLTGGASVHLIKGEDDMPDVITTMDFTAPTGDFSAPVFGLVPGSNLGQGFWAMSASALFIHRYDPIIVFYGGGYRHLFERTFDGIIFSPGEQISYQFGVGFSVNDRVTLSTALQGFYVTTTQIDHETIPGTNLEPISLRFAATIARRCRILEPFVMIGLTESAPAANLGIVVTFY